jgi:hypothetical protein
MKLFYKGKDGGAESSVTGWWLIEWKRLFSVALLKFEGASREAYHDHAFNSISWLLSGMLYEDFRDGKGHPYLPSIVPIITRRNTFHKVGSMGTSWVLTFRGPWTETWHENVNGEDITLSSGRVRVA